jgi:hypothetical protein
VFSIIFLPQRAILQINISNLQIIEPMTITIVVVKLVL